MKPFLQCSWTFDTEAWAFSISTGNFHFVRASVPERLALPASNVAVGSGFNLDFPILYVLHGNKELTLSLRDIIAKFTSLTEKVINRPIKVNLTTNVKRNPHSYM